MDGAGGIPGRTVRRPTTVLVLTSLVLAPVLGPGAGAGALPGSAHGSTEAAVRYGWGAPVAGDEFDYTGPPAVGWSVYDGPGHHGNGTRRPSAWRGDGSTMTVRGDASGTTGGMSADWPGADRRYGRWEVRMRTSVRDPRYHAVLLLWPQDAYRRGKCDGEVDYSESTADLTRTRFFLHHGCDNSQSRASVRNDTTAWHNYAVEWTPVGITGYLDGRPWFRDEDPDHAPPRPMHATIQLDYFPEDGTGPLVPTQMSVDWLREYPWSGPSGG